MGESWWIMVNHGESNISKSLDRAGELWCPTSLEEVRNLCDHLLKLPNEAQGTALEVGDAVLEFWAQSIDSIDRNCVVWKRSLTARPWFLTCSVWEVIRLLHDFARQWQAEEPFLGRIDDDCHESQWEARYSRLNDWVIRKGSLTTDLLVALCFGSWIWRTTGSWWSATNSQLQCPVSCCTVSKQNSSMTSISFKFPYTRIYHCSKSVCFVLQSLSTSCSSTSRICLWWSHFGRPLWEPYYFHPICSKDPWVPWVLPRSDWNPMILMILDRWHVVQDRHSKQIETEDHLVMFLYVSYSTRLVSGRLRTCWFYPWFSVAFWLRKGDGRRINKCRSGTCWPIGRPEKLLQST